jgi:predicted Mrr-cat superfamily restriction endonuclease
LKAVFTLSWYSYDKFELNTIYPTFTEQFEKEAEFDQLESELKKELKSRCVVNKIKDTKVNALALYYSDLATAQKEEESEEEQVKEEESAKAQN